MSKSKPTLFNFVGYQRKSSTFFSNHQCSRILFFDDRVELFEKVYPFQVCVPTVYIRCPGSIVIIEIEHCRHCIYTESIYVEEIHPEESIGNEKTVDLWLSVIKMGGSPSVVGRFVWILVFIGRSSIKEEQSMGISAKMSRNPIHDHADSFIMALIYKGHKIFRFTITRGHAVISSDLIAPRII